MIVLMYHDIVTKDDKSSGFQNDSAFQYKVEESVFEEQVKALQGKDVVFTFDDGGVSFITKAAPILEKYGFKGVFFIATKYIDTPGFLTVAQIQELHERGHQIGSHTHSHPANLSKGNETEIEEEWSSSIKMLSDIIGQPVHTASIPNGNGSKAVYKCAKKAGITELYTSIPTIKTKNEKGVDIVGRYVVHDSSSTEDVTRIVENKRYRDRMYVKWLVISAAKTVLGSFYKPIKSLIVK